MTETKWYALYTRAKTEKKVYDELEYAGFQAYLPLITKLKQWSDRKKKVIEPLFRNYVFVYTQTENLFKVLAITGAIRFITFENKVVSIPPEQIEAIKYYLNEKEFLPTEHFHFSEGQLVRVKHGQMAGLFGRLVRYQGKYKLVIRIEAIGKSMTLTIPRALVEPIA
jgi:transcription antitermination factor NusG